MKTNQSDIYFITYRKGDDNLLEGFKGKLQRKGLEALMMLKGEETILQTMNGGTEYGIGKMRFSKLVFDVENLEYP